MRPRADFHSVWRKRPCRGTSISLKSNFPLVCFRLVSSDPKNTAQLEKHRQALNCGCCTDPGNDDVFVQRCCRIAFHLTWLIQPSLPFPFHRRQFSSCQYAISAKSLSPPAYHSFTLAVFEGVLILSSTNGWRKGGGGRSRDTRLSREEEVASPTHCIQFCSLLFRHTKDLQLWDTADVKIKVPSAESTELSNVLCFKLEVRRSKYSFACFALCRNSVYLISASPVDFTSSLPPPSKPKPKSITQTNNKQTTRKHFFKYKVSSESSFNLRIYEPCFALFMNHASLWFDLHAWKGRKKEESINMKMYTRIHPHADVYENPSTWRCLQESIHLKMYTRIHPHEYLYKNPST